MAAEMGVSRACAYKWWNRWKDEGKRGLIDRPSHAHNYPKRTPACTETRIRIARHLTRRGPVAIGAQLKAPASTVGRVLRRHRTPPLAACDPVTGQVIRASRRSANRYEHDRPGSLVHVDVKKLGRIPDGGGWRAHGRGTRPAARRGLGYDYVHAAVDDHSRLAYAEVLGDEKGATCAGFLTRSAAFYAAHGIDRIERVITDNAKNYPDLPGLRRGRRCDRRDPQVHPPALPVDQRKGRAVQPHPRGRVGLLPRLRQQSRPCRPLASLAGPLQPEPATPGHRRALTHQPRQQRCGSVHLGQVLDRLNWLCGGRHAPPCPPYEPSGCWPGTRRANGSSTASVSGRLHLRRRFGDAVLG